MRKSKYDKYVCLVCLLVFLYSFLIVGFEPLTKSDIKYPDRPLWWTDDDSGEVIAIKWSSAVLVAPLCFLMFFFFMVFDDKLLEVDRYWVKDNLIKVYRDFKEKIREGIDEYHKYRK